MPKDMNAEMARHAQAAIEMVRSAFGHELDLSEATIGAVESLLNAFHESDDTTPEMLTNTALMFGAYIGELVRAHCPHATWTDGSLTPDAPPPSLVVGSIEISPLVWCFKRLHNGSADSVVDKYLAFRDAAIERGELG
jgi:hypothetical protein